MVGAFLKNALMYPPLVKAFINRFLEFYVDLLWFFGMWIVIAILIRYLYLRFFKKGGEILRTIEKDGMKIYDNFFQAIGKLITTKFAFLKDMLLGGIIVGLAGIFVPLLIFFVEKSQPIEYMKEQVGTSGDYVAFVNTISSNGISGVFLAPAYIQEHSGFILWIVSLVAMYMVGLWILGGFFITFCFGNKALRNIGIGICTLSFLLLIGGVFLHSFVNIFQ